MVFSRFDFNRRGTACFLALFSAEKQKKFPDCHDRFRKAVSLAVTVRNWLLRILRFFVAILLMLGLIWIDQAG
jgi:hypothetical protein